MMAYKEKKIPFDVITAKEVAEVWEERHRTHRPFTAQEARKACLDLGVQIPDLGFVGAGLLRVSSGYGNDQWNIGLAICESASLLGSSRYTTLLYDTYEKISKDAKAPQPIRRLAQTELPKIVERMSQHAAAGVSHSLVRMGLFHERQKRLSEAKECYSRAGEDGDQRSHGEALVRLGNILEQEGDLNQAWTVWKRGCELDSPECHFHLATIIPPRSAAYLELLFKAAASGISQAAIHIARYYENIHEPPDPAMAKEWYRVGFANGLTHPQAPWKDLFESPSDLAHHLDMIGKLDKDPDVMKAGFRPY